MFTRTRHYPKLAAVLIFLSGLTLAGPAVGEENNVFSAKQKSALEALIRNYILDHPEVVIESLQRMEKRERIAHERQQATRVAALADAIAHDPDDPIIGNSDGDVTLVEFFDYQCGYCKQMIEPLLDLANSDGRLRIVMKEFPILGPVSVTAASAALAARNQNRYEEFHIALMQFRGRLSESAIFQAAREVGLDTKRLQSDMQAPEITAHFEQVKRLASALSINGTPAFIINGIIIPGAVSLDRLEAEVKEARAGG